MALREFIKRHRIASAAAGPAVLGVAAIVAASWGLMATPETRDTRLTSSVTECHDMVTISVAGRNDSPDPNKTAMLVDANGNALPAALSSDYSSHWVDPVVNAPADKVDPGSYAAVYVAYPANMSTYEQAVDTGVANAEKVMHDIAQACPDTKFSIVGYSEGADVARRVAMGIGHDQPGADGKYDVVDPKNVLGVVILADAGRTAGDGPFPGAQDPNHPDGFDQNYQNGNKPISGQGALPDQAGDFGALNGKVASFCSEGDLTCAAPQNISLLQLAANVGRQLNVDALQNEGLTPATGQDVAVTLGRIAMNAFSYIASQPNWMASNETFLQVLLKVSEPGYKPGDNPPAPAPAQSISTDQMAPLAYLPQKVLNEIIGLIVTNQNTIPVIMSDPYQLTLGPNGTGHHFDYWRDSDAANGKPMTSAEYAAAWLTHLAQQAQAGQQIDPKSQPTQADVQAAYKTVQDTKAADAKAATTTSPAPTTTAPAPTTATPTTTSSSTAPTTTQAPATTTTTVAPAEPPARTQVAAPVETTAPPTTQSPTTQSTTTEPTTTQPTTTSAAPTTTATK
ncbi:cutinase [Nocardia sp. 852002-20019_SCH5090214]|uniref:Cutinase family protein n=1 Tax=Nocardia nova TaxID=37330 RepID=A0A2S6AEW5_9NOCA|nr:MULTISPECIES: cutinase family protein [Nocardia]OBA47126.1 cutinase [Nocardia sp. 852002-20019_SCH5090214]PPJ32914.1 cutinase family protein [Nocardia nova]